VIVIDTSHGACTPAKEQITRIRKAYGDAVDIMVGNIASYDSAMYLLKGKHRPDSLKVGIGPGSICTTRQVTGHGVPQLTAIYQVWKAVQDFGKKTGYYVPIIADGGIRTSGDIVKCLAGGASAVMLGSVFASCDEAPGEVVWKGGKAYKTIRGMGSRSAMEARSGSRGRYHRQGADHGDESLTKAQKTKIVPEGVVGLVQLKGSVESIMTELCGGIQSGLAHSGATTVSDFRQNARMWRQSAAGTLEGRPHDLSDIRN